MTPQDKQLLLKDLCARLLYGVKMSNINAIHNGLDLPPITIDINDYKNSNPLILINSGFIPYLRPMSSMTEEEIKEFHHMASMERDYLGDDNFYTHYQMIDWLYAHHFDFRGLIPMGLALEAKEGMYKTE